MEEIKISDLSIGDLVEVQGVVKRIDYLYGKDNVCDVPIELVHPIPLTPEILEKNGFRKNGEYNEWNTGKWYERPFIGVSLDRQSMRVKYSGNDIFIENKVVYVHQLQHALRLAGVEKEIEL